MEKPVKPLKVAAPKPVKVLDAVQEQLRDLKTKERVCQANIQALLLDVWHLQVVDVVCMDGERWQGKLWGVSPYEVELEIGDNQKHVIIFKHAVSSIAPV